MKITSLLFVCACFAMMISCESENPEVKNNELSENVRAYLSLKMSNGSQFSVASGYGQGNPVNDSFRRLYGSANGLTSGRMKGDSTVADTTIYPEPWTTCAVFSTIENADGSITNIMDYGDGCEEGNEYWKYFMKGRYEYTYKSTISKHGTMVRDTYAYNSKSVNYGGRYYYENDTTEWLANGESTYGGSSEYDTAAQTYTGSYNYSSNETYTWNDVTYHTQGASVMSYTTTQYIVEESDFTYSTDDDFYRTTVLTPLVTKYDCWGPIQLMDSSSDIAYYIPYVSGIELIRYKNGSDEGSFQIDYGNGECDSKITIIENGVRNEIDLASPDVFAYDK